MIAHSQSFKILKEEVQKSFDFAILTVHAVPFLKNRIRRESVDLTKKLPFAPDHFDDRPIPAGKIISNAQGYKEILAKNLLLSSFSYFEAYFNSLLKEVVDYHSEARLMSKVSPNSVTLSPTPDVAKAKRKLQESRSSQKIQRYKLYSAQLASAGYQLPSQLLSHYGMLQLIELAKGDKIKSVEIPDLAGQVFNFTVDDAQKDLFHKYRGMRNNIAHGKTSKKGFALPEAVEANEFLRNFALKMDQHVVKYYFLAEEN